MSLTCLLLKAMVCVQRQAQSVQPVRRMKETCRNVNSAEQEIYDDREKYDLAVAKWPRAAAILFSKTRQADDEMIAATAAAAAV
jgi:hypothetical protein